MLVNITYHNPTKLIFGKDALASLAAELTPYNTIQLVYGSGSIRRFGIYNQVVETLRAAGKTIVEDSGVMPNPTIEKLREGAQIARDNDVDFILAVGGGSCVDYAKAVAVSKDLPAGEDPWDVYFDRFEEPAADREVVPVGSVLTMVGTGSEMNRGSVITNRELGRKIGHVFTDERVSPRFAVLNPEFTYTVPRYQMVAGIFDIMNHITEQYFSNTDDNTSDYLAEGLMRSLVTASRAAVANPTDYEARSNIMWTATWALNTLIAKGKTEDWMVHMLGQAVGAYTNATHGMTLSAVSMPYYRHILPYGAAKFARYAVNVWGVDQSGKTEREVAEEGLCRMETWMKKLGLVMHLTELGVTPNMIDGIASATLVMDGGYKVLTSDEIKEILKASL